MTTQTDRTTPGEAVFTPWPPDDTEESIVGIDLHQSTILMIRLGLNEVARLLAPLPQPVPWQATDQLLLLGCVRPDGSPYRTYPDVFVYAHPIDVRQSSFSLADDGAPVLIVEVLSPSTQAAELLLRSGKGYSYARAGVQEYLVLDPLGEYLKEGGRGWRLEGGRYRPWERDAAGRWVCGTIAAAITLEGARVQVSTHAGRVVPREGEIMAELNQREAERDEARRQRDAESAMRHQREAELAALRRELDELRGQGRV